MKSNLNLVIRMILGREYQRKAISTIALLSLLVCTMWKGLSLSFASTLILSDRLALEQMGDTVLESIT